jgi:hypothetical protein
MARDADFDLTHGEILAFTGDDGLRITVKLRHRKLSEYVRLCCEMKGAPLAEHVESLTCWAIAGWAGVRHNGRSLPFSRQGLAVLLALRPDLGAALLTAINKRMPSQEMVAAWYAEQGQGQECEQ